MADRLLAAGDEAALRTAVSRAYYAVFHAARRRRAMDAGAPTSRNVGHQELWDYFKNSPTTRAIGVGGERLLKRRQKADYDVSPAWDRVNTEQAVSDAKSLLRALEPD